MDNNKFWNEVAKYGAVIGAMLAASSLLETTLSLSGNVNFFLMLGIEYLLIAAVHYYLLHRYTRRYSLGFNAEQGFSFGKGYSYIMLLSAFAGVIVGCVNTIYLHAVLGYQGYLDKFVASFEGLISSGFIPAGQESLVMAQIETIQNAAIPSVLATVWGGVFGSLLFGAIYGLIIAGVISRQPRPFEPEVKE